MLNLNESNRIVMSQHPADMWMGINCLDGQILSGQARQVDLEPQVFETNLHQL